MITRNEIKDINEAIKNSSNPIFMYDSDIDGLCSYLILKRHYRKGKGIVIKSYPALNSSYLEIIRELNPDLIVVLDKAEIEQEFIDKVFCKIIWIDHHPLKNMRNINYYNPLKHNKNDNRPTTFLAYSTAKSSLWIAMVGCVSDYYMPKFADKFIKEYPGLIKDSKNISEALYNSELGKLIRIMAFNLKGKKRLVDESLNALDKINSPYEILNGLTEEGKFLLERANKLIKEYEKLLEEAKSQNVKDKLLLFIYPERENSFTSDLAGELSYLYNDKIIIVGREKEDKVIMSLRSKKIPLSKKLEKALIGINGYGWGHKFACGASVKKEDFERFIENIKQEI